MTWCASGGEVIDWARPRFLPPGGAPMSHSSRSRSSRTGSKIRPSQHGSSRRRARGIVAGASALAVLGALAIGSPPQAAASPPAPADRDQAFHQAAREFGVPTSLLEALSYAQTRWD